MMLEHIEGNEGTGLVAEHNQEALEQINAIVDLINQFLPTVDGRPPIRITVEGGLAILLTNKTGAPTVKGSVVEPDTTTDEAFKLSVADSYSAIGVVYQDGIVDGAACWVVIVGIAEVLIKDGTTATRGYWVGTADAIGRVDITNANPPGLVDAHFRELGHCIQSKASGTDVLAKVVLHFN